MKGSSGETRRNKASLYYPEDRLKTGVEATETAAKNHGQDPRIWIIHTSLSLALACLLNPNLRIPWPEHLSQDHLSFRVFNDNKQLAGHLCYRFRHRCPRLFPLGCTMTSVSKSTLHLGSLRMTTLFPHSFTGLTMDTTLPPHYL